MTVFSDFEMPVGWTPISVADMNNAHDEYAEGQDEVGAQELSVESKRRQEVAALMKRDCELF